MVHTHWGNVRGHLNQRLIIVGSGQRIDLEQYHDILHEDMVLMQGDQTSRFY